MSEIKPIRIQRSRKGKQISLNGLPIIYCGRPGIWGNPFKLSGDIIYVNADYRRKILSPWICYSDGGGNTIEDVIKLFYDLMMDLNSHKVEYPIYKKFKLMRDRIKDLEGKNLSCWCSINQPCHANILLKLANA